MKLSSLFLVLSVASSRVDEALGQCTGCADPTHCCSKWGFCGSGDAYCGADCAYQCPGGPSPTPPSSGNYNYCGTSWGDAGKCGTTCYDASPTPCPGGEGCFADVTSCPVVTGPGPGPSPTPPPPPSNCSPPTSTAPLPATAEHDSRLIAYVGNWEPCPAPEEVDAYTHIVIAFAVSYTYAPTQNTCDTQCNVPSSLPVCVGGDQATIDAWRAAGKKVIMSFGGAGMGGSWTGDNNNCWDYCFGREDQLSTQLVSMTSAMNLDGIDLDYEYCYDIAGTQSGRCAQRTSSYSDAATFDAAAQNFLTQMTVQLRTKLGPGKELTHAPMDSDMDPASPYYAILRDNQEKLDFLMVQFYNGGRQPHNNGFVGSGTSTYYDNIATDLFPNRPDKVVFGFCITCTSTSENASGSQAVSVLDQVKTYNSGAYACNGGAFFWVARCTTAGCGSAGDTCGSWSDPVWEEVSKTSGCSAAATTSTTSTTAAATTSTSTTTTTTSTSTSVTTQPPPPSTTTSTSTSTTTTTQAHPGQCSTDSTPCSAPTDCNCRRLLKGSRAKNDSGNRLRKRRLAKPPKDPKTPGPTPAPTPKPTSSPTKTTTTVATTTTTTTIQPCTCILPTTAATTQSTSTTTQAATTTTAAVTTQATTTTQAATTTQGSGNCYCADYTQKNLCEDGCDANGVCNCGPDACEFPGRTKVCTPL